MHKFASQLRERRERRGGSAASDPPVAVRGGRRRREGAPVAKLQNSASGGEGDIVWEREERHFFFARDRCGIR